MRSRQFFSILKVIAYNDHKNHMKEIQEIRVSRPGSTVAGDGKLAFFDFLCVLSNLPLLFSLVAHMPDFKPVDEREIK